MQEATLPQRLARSAKNLASATLTGSNFELRDPRESKQAGSSSTQTSLGSKEYCSGNAHSKIISSHRQDEFRSRPDSMIRRQTEEEFDHFQATDDFQKWQNQGVSAYYEPICGADVLRGESSIIADENQTINAVKTIAVVTDHVTDMLDFSETPKSTSVVEVKSARDVNVSYSHAAAIQRLNQIGAHLQRNVAMQALEQNTLAQSHKAMHGMTFDVQVEHAHEISDELRDPGQSDEQHKSRYVDERHSSSSHPAARNKASAGPVRKGKEKEQEEPQRRFHCPYYACHQNMQMLATSISNSSQRSCVHVGCDFYGETSNLWNEHVHTPHHDLQG